MKVEQVHPVLERAGFDRVRGGVVAQELATVGGFPARLPHWSRPMDTSPGYR